MLVQMHKTNMAMESKAQQQWKEAECCMLPLKEANGKGANLSLIAAEAPEILHPIGFCQKKM